MGLNDPLVENVAGCGMPRLLPGNDPRLVRGWDPARHQGRWPAAVSPIQDRGLAGGMGVRAGCRCSVTSSACFRSGNTVEIMLPAGASREADRQDEPSISWQGGPAERFDGRRRARLGKAAWLWERGARRSKECPPYFHHTPHMFGLLRNVRGRSYDCPMLDCAERSSWVVRLRRPPGRRRNLRVGRP